MHCFVASILVLVPSGALAGSAFRHLVDAQRFRAVLIVQGIVPYPLVAWTAAVVVAAELACASLGVLAGMSALSDGRFVPIGLAVTSLMFVFAGYVAILLLRGRPVPCGCFGSQKPASFETVLRASVLGLAPVAAVVVSV